MDAVDEDIPTGFLPALARDIVQWFPELGGRALAVAEVQLTPENKPTLPLAMLAFTKEATDQPQNSSRTTLDLVDDFVIEFWFEPARYKKTDGSESPFWAYYDYTAIRNTLLSHLLRNYIGPNGERVRYRTMQIEATPFAVTLTFVMQATYRWCATELETDIGQVITPKTFVTNICTPKTRICDELDEPDRTCNPCDEEGS